MSPSRSTRFASMVLDHLLMVVVAFCFAIPSIFDSFITFFGAAKSNSNELFSVGGLEGGSSALTPLALVGFALYFCKDCLDGRSPAKRILRLQVVRTTTGLPASPLRTLTRNAFLVLWPIEGIVALINPERRLGDLVAGTKLSSFVAGVNPAAYNYRQIICTLAIAYASVVIGWYAFTSKEQSDMATFSWPSFDEASDDVDRSVRIQQILTDSLPHVGGIKSTLYVKCDSTNAKYLFTKLEVPATLFAVDSIAPQLADRIKVVSSAALLPGRYFSEILIVDTTGRASYRIRSHFTVDSLNHTDH